MPMRTWMLAVLAGLVWLGNLNAAEESGKRSVLIVTGEDYWHDWKATTPVVREFLSADSRLKVEVLSDLTQFKNKDLDSYSVVVIHFRNASPEVPGHEALENVRRFVRKGGGLVLVHFACGAFHEYHDEYLEMTGRVWFGEKSPPGSRQHDPRGPFRVNIETKHPLAAGVSDFDTDDELYTCLEGDAPVDLLASAVSGVDGKTYPLAFTHEFGKGRVFVCTLGHDVRALKPPAVGELYRRGVAWAAGMPIAAEKTIH